MFGLFNENVSPYISVSELIEGNNVNRNVQVFGDVLVESIDFDTQSGILTFDITDGESTATIQHQGIISNLVNASEVVALGEYSGGIFKAEKVLVKCPSKYEELEETDD
jgi:cytochrome c-type biogenesis protein CcmE